MDLGGASWASVTIVGVLVLAVVLLWAMLRNKAAKGRDLDRTEAATRELYRQEDAATREDDDRVP